MHNVLVFPSKTEIGREVVRSLKYSKHFNVFDEFNTDPKNGPITTTVFDEANVEQVLNVATKLGACVIPCHDELLAKLSGHPLCVWGHSPSKSWRNKLETYLLLEDIVRCPESPDKPPFFAKPREGQGSKGAVKIDNVMELKHYLTPEYVVSEYLPGKEYTVDCFSTKGELKYFQPRERVGISNGIATDTRLVTKDRFDKEISAINDFFKFHGPWFAQFKEDKHGAITLMEVAPRIAGSSGINRINGVNLTELSLWQYFGHEVEIIPQEAVDSYSRQLSCNYYPKWHYHHIIVDWDDTLKVKDVMNYDRLNYELLGKLYTSKLRGSTITLLTRNPQVHREIWSLSESLFTLFDSIRIIPEGSSKDEISYGEVSDAAIFIDDSFKERKDLAPYMLTFNVQEALEVL